METWHPFPKFEWPDGRGIDCDVAEVIKKTWNKAFSNKDKRVFSLAAPW